MKNYKTLTLSLLMILVVLGANGQDETATKDRPVRPMFESAYLMDNQSVIVYQKNTLEWAMQHKFGSIENGFDDYFGLWGVSNIRMGFTYVPINNLAVGYGITQNKMLQDFNIKYAFLQQTRSGRIPLSITYYGNMAIDSRKRDDIVYYSKYGDRVSYFHQIILARRVSSKLSVQISPSLSHYNAAPAIVEDGEVIALRENDHLAISASARYKVVSQGSITVDYNLPITNHPQNNPKGGFAFGYEISTSSHAFQLYMGQYRGLVPQENNYNNLNTEFQFGFNITKLWSL